ncbi:MAG: hypothetical protein EBT07_07795 [Actinobacteria bacterium]|nr:hypothetical protein [Actinomycetota bacterium]
MNNQKPAFPIPDFDEQGMTLRDYFAAKAMQATMNNLDEQKYWGEEYSIEEMLLFTAERAYEQADAMMKVREEL